MIYIKYSNAEIKEIKTDLYNTGIELIKQINNYKEDITSETQINYNLIYKDKILPFEDLLINSIGKEDVIKLSKRNTTKFLIKTMYGKQFYFNLDPNDTVKLLKILIQFREGYPISQIRLLFKGKYLEDNKTFADDVFKKDSTLLLALKLT